MNKLLICLGLLVVLASADIGAVIDKLNKQGVGNFNKNEFEKFDKETATSGGSTLDKKVTSGFNIGGFDHCKLSLT